MGKKNPRHRTRRTRLFETLEERIAMSADPIGGLLGGALSHHAFYEQDALSSGGYAVEQHGGFDGALSHHNLASPDFSIGTTLGGADQSPAGVDQHLSQAHDQSGLTQVRANYGFRGFGQTVAVIDSGVAYDHYALGGGFGAGYRVVGGWDFTNENDGDPYDDGPSGSHGTHVSGIIGADSGADSSSGVAPGVDIVGLRVFDDNGDGYFSWVEDALQWVHANRFAFENPITTVNLSLGTDWNSSSVPGWAMLENEFAQLKADGIFISVSAGNSFADFDAPGLSYPAASSHVVPVMATDDNGSLSYFSQRHERAIAAPGRWIYSTVPDYIGNHNGVTDDWANMSGTSMAAPYVAGASVIVREAMEFVGFTGITQDTIYDHIRATADTLHDAATNADYLRLNLETAINALIPEDDFGSDAGTAYQFGTLVDGAAISGLIGSLDDRDYFAFTAGVTGTVTFTANTTHALAAGWLFDGDGGGASGAQGEVFTFDVVAGEDYAIGLSSTSGLGYFDITVDIESSFSAVDWGVISFREHGGVESSTEAWYQFQASQAGFLTVEAFFANGSGDVNLELYNAEFELVDSSTSAEDWERVDAYASGGETFFLKVSGANSNVDFRLSNLVSINGNTLEIDGTSGDDVFSFAAGSPNFVAVNGVLYHFAVGEITHFAFAGGDGDDSIIVTGSDASETATLSVGHIAVVGIDFTLSASSVEDVTFHGGGGYDRAYFNDSAGDDRLTASPNAVIFEGGGVVNRADGIERADATSSLGYDTAKFYDSLGVDLYRSWSSMAIMSGAGFYNRATGFDRTEAVSAHGHDTAIFYDSLGDDLYRAWSTMAIMSGAGFYNHTLGFDRTEAKSYHGNDTAIFYDSLGDDLYRAWDGIAVMSGDGFYNHALGFGRTEAKSYYGHDTAIFYDSLGDDLYRAWSTMAIMSGAGFYNHTLGFDRTEAKSYHGSDTAIFYDSLGDDLYRAWSNMAIMSGAGFYNHTLGFSRTEAKSYYGDDTAIFYDSIGDDLYRAWDGMAVMQGNGFYNHTLGFDRTEAYSTSGNDRAVLYDSVFDDFVTARDWGASMQSGNCFNKASGFGRIEALGVHGGVNAADVAAVDYLFALVGDWV